MGRKATELVNVGPPPTYSPDLNCIENLFSVADTHVLKKHKEGPASSKGETCERFEEYVRGLEGTGVVRKLVNSMPRRMQACIESEGGPTPY